MGLSDQLIAQQFTALGHVEPEEHALPEPELVTIRGDGVDLAARFLFLA